MKKKQALSLALAALCCLGFSACTHESVGEEYEVNAYRTTMQFHDDFKIMQLTDLHFGIESNLQKQLNFVVAAIEEADPDLIILTGDNFMYASKSIVYNLFNTLNETCKKLTDGHPTRLTKFAVTYGNHDNQGDYPRYYANKTLLSFAAKDGEERATGKYAAFVDYEDDNLFGLTNYFIDLVDDRAKSVDEVDVKYRLHIIDSNSYHFNGIKYDYDIIHADQVAHVEKIQQMATADKDYIGLAFFHIPLVEFEEAEAQYDAAADKTQVGQGAWKEDGLYHGYADNDVYEKLRGAGILAFHVGHDHQNHGEILYNASSATVGEKAIFSFGVKSTDQLYHFQDMMGYKTIALKDGMTQESFLSIGNINANYHNVTDRYEDYE